MYNRNIDELTDCNGSTCLYDAIHQSYEQVTLTKNKTLKMDMNDWVIVLTDGIYI